jgi:hypothetical protein
MSITRTVTKKVLENIVHETFSNFGSISSSALLDSLKFLGFYYATNAGISINIEDLKTPDMKKDFLKNANEEMKDISERWQQGFVSDTERFQKIIDSWNFATESLKDRIVDYYENFDPANNLYIMAFSGARGNMSQVRQLVGMRGLMADQEGKIIDLPIQTNFREGLSSIDYIISSYGARKGIVDTALKTADSGYLTRRLIYIAQDLIIREIDCHTTKGVIVLLKTNTNFKNIVGRTLISATSSPTPDATFDDLWKDLLLEETLLTQLKQRTPLSLKIRSPLTCNSSGSVCQKCYGWDLAQKKMISLGEAVGIIAAQSIGEPGTQLTMRTFHTGGIFTSELVKQTLSPFSGKIHISDSLKTVIYRTTHGLPVLKLQQESSLTIVNWKGIEEEIFLEIGSLLYITKSGFVTKNQLISEYADRSTIPPARRLKPIYTSMSGEISFESLLVRHIPRENKPKVKVNQDDGVLWLAAGKILPLPKEAKYQEREYLKTNRSCAKLYITSPFQGIVNISESGIILFDLTRSLKLDFGSLMKILTNYRITFSLLAKNYQYVDTNTILGVLNIFPKHNGKIYSVRQKVSQYLNILFLITEDDVWKINADQVNNFDCFPSISSKKNIVRSGTNLNLTSEFNKAGFFLKKDGFKMVFQNALPIFLSRGTILNYNKGDFVFENQILATLVNYTQQTEDIVQGLPKIEALIEARVPKNKAYLAKRPGIFIQKSKSLLNATVEKDTLIYSYGVLVEKKGAKKKAAKKKTVIKKQTIKIIHSFHLNQEPVYFNNQMCKATLVPNEFKPFLVHKKTATALKNQEYIFKNENTRAKLINGKRLSSKWKKILANWIRGENREWQKVEQPNVILYRRRRGKLIKWLERDVENFSFENGKNEYIIKTTTNEFVFLEPLDPITEYKVPLNLKSLAQSGHFIDIGEPITTGIIDPHELLNALFEYHEVLDGTLVGTLKSLNKFQLLVVNSVQAIYQSQGVNISSKHIEIIVRQMTAKVLIKKGGDTPFLPGEMINLSLMSEVYKAMQSMEEKRFYKTPEYAPVFLSTTRSSLDKDGFLSAAGFQETKRILSKSALEGKSDWLRGLKECIIIGRLIPAGSAFLNYKNYLDNIYLFKK